tara:strand:+ start:6306 stop:7106 length:801 start_codon:yes stop_codon:yes gene_type:complete
MKKLKAKFTNRAITKEMFVKKYSNIHTNKYSDVKNEFYSKSIVNAEEETLVSDLENTNNNETGHTIIVTAGEIYNLINNILPERKSVTELKKSAINKFIEKQNKFNIIKPQITQIGFLPFFDNVYNDVYKEFIVNKELVSFYDNMYKSLDETSTFYISIKDSLGNEFSRTTTATQEKIQVKNSTLLQAAVNDATTTNKDGFNIGEDFYLFYINTYYSVEFPINFDVSGVNTTIQDKGQTIISNLLIKEKFQRQFNPEYFELLVPLK